MNQPLTEVDAGTAFTLGFRLRSRLESRAAAERLLERTAVTLTFGGPVQHESERTEWPDLFTHRATGSLKLRLTGADAEAPGYGRPEGLRVALAISADVLATGLGRDIYEASLVAERPGKHIVLTNLGCRAEERVHGHRGVDTKLAAGERWPLHLGGGTHTPLEFTWGGGVLYRSDDLPKVWLASAALTAALSERIQLTFGSTWSDRPARLTFPVRSASVGIRYALLRQR